MRARAALSTAATLLALAPAAHAADPIMPTSQVRSGMRCKAYTVVRGTEIASFDVEVLDVVQDPSIGPRILVRVSGPAVDETGVAAGFSGSPVYCPDDQGTQRNAGAISEITGDYGNKVALATPIEEMLREPAVPATGPRPRQVAGRRARSLAGPLTVAGLSRPLERALASTARRGGRFVIASPRAPTLHAAAQPLRPGSSVAVGLSSGDLWIGAVGTVTYTDGDTVWLFGHPLDAAGRRSLFLQDAYVHTVIANPNPEIGSYKLGSAGADVGTATNDAFSAVVGRVGPLPPRTDVEVSARDLGSDRVVRTSVLAADESALDVPAGFSALSFVAPLAVADASARALSSIPARSSGSMCARIALAARSTPLRFCNRYVVQHGGGIGGPVADDLARAVALIDEAEFAPLAVDRVEADLTVRRAGAQAYVVGASLPRRVRAGSRVPVSLRTRVVRGSPRRFDFRLSVPAGLRPGTYTLRLEGTEPDDGDLLGGAVEDILILQEEGFFGDEGEASPPRSFDELESRFAKIRRYDGVRARFTRSGSKGKLLRAFRDPDLRIGGTLKLRVVVTR
ncbi:MAG TPA: hypothetical protein VF520_09865 [Thermoleophilaceae bacterium]|jgi:hypothetical protein